MNRIAAARTHTRKLQGWVTLAFAIVTLFGTSMAFAQDTKPNDQNSKPETQKIKSAAPTYRLTYTITDLDGTKRLGVQHFSLTLNPDAPNASSEIKLGSKIPIATGSFPVTANVQTQFTYVDVGLDINARLTSYANGVMVDTTVYQTSVADAPTADIHQPIIRQANLRNTALLTLGKPVMIGSLDTPGSTRHLDIEIVLEPVR